jgi:hypothetical protein
MPEWVHTVSAWIIVHKDHVTLLSGGIQAATAAIVVFLTVFLWKENRHLRKAGTEPEVVAYLVPDKRHLHVMNLVVTNVGRGAARNVSVELVGDVEALRKKGARVLVSKIAVLPQDERFAQMFGNSLDFFDGGPPRDFSIHVYFENGKGRRFEANCRASIADFEGLSRVTPPEHDIAEAMKKIAAKLESWGH